MTSHVEIHEKKMKAAALNVFPFSLRPCVKQYILHITITITVERKKTASASS